jgi:hypothetical protein
MRNPYFVFERAGSERAFDLMRQTGPRSSINVLPNFRFRPIAERIANELNSAYSLGKRLGLRRVKKSKALRHK